MIQALQGGHQVWDIGIADQTARTADRQRPETATGDTVSFSAQARALSDATPVDDDLPPVERMAGPEERRQTLADDIRALFPQNDISFSPPTTPICDAEDGAIPISALSDEDMAAFLASVPSAFSPSAEPADGVLPDPALFDPAIDAPFFKDASAPE